VAEPAEGTALVRSLALLAALALVGCAAPAPPHHAERPRLLCAIYLYRYPDLVPPRRWHALPETDDVNVVGHTAAPGCREAAESARRTFLIEEEIR
jgi:hypothetical protein